MHEIPILYEEDHFLVINKPSGIFSQAAPGIDSIQELLARQLKSRDQHPGKPFIGLPHRLDFGTSGTMLIARNQRALKRFGAQFQSRKVAKFYTAVLEGKLECAAQGFEQWHDFIRKVPNQPVAEICGEDAEGARTAHLAIRALAHANQNGDSSASTLTLALIQLHTGRMHQIRAQAASRNLPILGDSVYGEHRPDDIASATQASFPCLHALRIEFHHPQTARRIAVTAPIFAAPEVDTPPQTGWQSAPQVLIDRLRALIDDSQRYTQSWGSLT